MVDQRSLFSRRGRYPTEVSDRPSALELRTGDASPLAKDDSALDPASWRRHLETAGGDEAPRLVKDYVTIWQQQALGSRIVRNVWGYREQH
jgi:hypothetical protein